MAAYGLLSAVMQTKAAILWETNTPWSVEDIELDDPKEGEVSRQAGRLRHVSLR